MKISKGKLALIHTAKARLGLDEDSYRSLLLESGGVTSAKELDIRGFELLLERFAELGFQTSKAQRIFGRRTGMATPDQVEYIRNLWVQYIGKEDDVSLNHWLENSFGITALRFADLPTAGKAITALKSMTKRRNPPSQ